MSQEPVMKSPETGGWRNGFSLVMWGGAALLMMAPYVGMQVSDEVNWTAFDFATFAGMLVFLCGGVELTLRLSGNFAYRIGAALALIGAFLLFWITGAVGIVGSEQNPLNLMYLGVIAVGIVGAFVGRFRAREMAHALAVTAIVQGLAGAAALVLSRRELTLDGTTEIVGLSGFFAALFLGSSMLFARAAREQAAAA